EDLIVSAVLLNDVDDVFDRRAAGEETRTRWPKQPVVSHYLLRVSRQTRIIRQRNRADVADYQRGAVLPALSSTTTSFRKELIWRIRNAPGVVYDHRRIFQAGALTIA